MFVGNLPEGTTKEELTELFQRFGPVVDSNVVTKVYPGNSINVFGFVEFITAAQANAAALVEQYLGNNKLRIEPKEYSTRRGSRINAMPVATPIRTPRRVSPSANVALAMRLVRNEMENTGTTNVAPPGFTPPATSYGEYPPQDFATPHHYLPAHLFSPSPPGPFYGEGPYYYGPY